METKQLKTLLHHSHNLVFRGLLLVASLVSLLSLPQTAQATLSNGFPEKLAFYYGKPSQVNGANGDTTLATQTFKDYDIVVFANEMDSPTHLEHAAAQTIIQNLQAYGTRSYGYVDLCWDGGVYCTGLPIEEIQAKTDRWAAMGVAGIFLDQVGYEYAVSRERLNAAVGYIHSQGLSAFVNVWNPDDVFSPEVHPTLNPNGTPTLLGPNDYSLHESFAVTLSQYQDPAFLIEKAEKGLKWKKIYGTKMATVNTVAQSNPAFDQAQFDYVWWMTLLYGYDAMAWGETWVYSSDTNSLPFHPRPNPHNGDIGSAVDPLNVTHSGSIHRRSTSLGYVEVDTTTHQGKFVEGAPPPPPTHQNFVTQPGTQSTDLIAGEATFLANQATFTLQSNGAPIQAYRLFLDTDKNVSTGFLYWQNPGSGGDYLIENGYLYRYAGASQTDWSWNFLGPVTTTGLGSLRIQVALSFSQIGYVAGNPMAVLAENFNPATYGSYDVLLRAPGVWVVQSTVKQAANAVSQTGNAPTDLIAGRAEFSASQLTFTLQSNGAMINAYRIFIDRDVSEATGFLHSSNTGIGGDYLIENGYLYQHTGATQNDWSWNFLGQVTTTGLGTNQIQVTLDFSQINYTLGTNLAVLAEHFDPATYASYDVLLRAPGVWLIEFLSNTVSQTATTGTDLTTGKAVFQKGQIVFDFRTQGAPINFYRIFLDVDASKGTGFLHWRNANVGSEYLIENGQLYRFTGSAQFEWNWTWVGPVTASNLGTSQMQVKVNYSPIGYLAGEKLGVLVENVNPNDYSTLDMIFRSPGVWLIQSSGLSPNEAAQTGNANTDLVAGNVGFIGNQIIFTFKSNGASINSYRIFLDRDAKKTTGFVHSWNPNVGGDLLIENGNLYQFTGAAQSDWSWAWLGTVNATGVGTSKIQVIMDFSQIGYLSGEKLSLLVEHVNPGWATYDILLRDLGMWKVK